MQAKFETIDHFLTRAVRGDPYWPPQWSTDEIADRVHDRVTYHGVAALLADRLTAADGWPDLLRKRLRDEGVARAMWELRHQDLLKELLASLAERGIFSVILKGTALAYDVYANPACRLRGDTDLLVAPKQIEGARAELSKLGYRCTEVDDGFALQESWSIQTDQVSTHFIDLHWQLLNSHALRTVLPPDECLRDKRPLPRLSEFGFGMNSINSLIHTCVHRAMHIKSPYLIEGKSYYGGDRLIWSNDIHLLASSFSKDEWKSFAQTAIHYGVARACLDGLTISQDRFGTGLDPETIEKFRLAKSEAASAYLLKSGQIGRARSDIKAIRGARAKIYFVARQLVPSVSFMRSKYPDMRSTPFPILYLRRLLEFFQKRPSLRS